MPLQRYSVTAADYARDRRAEAERVQEMLRDEEEEEEEKGTEGKRGELGGSMKAGEGGKLLLLSTYLTAVVVVKLLWLAFVVSACVL